MSKRIASLLLAVAAAAALSGCASTSSGSTNANASMAATNKTCCCGKPVDGKTTVSYKGQTIGVCSPACADYFSKASDADKAKMAAKVTSTAK